MVSNFNRHSQTHIPNEPCLNGKESRVGVIVMTITGLTYVKSTRIRKDKNVVGSVSMPTSRPCAPHTRDGDRACESTF